MTNIFDVLVTLFFCMMLGGIAVIILLAIPNSRLRSCVREAAKYFVAIILAVLIVSPLDLIPMIPVDDIAYLFGSIAAVKAGSKNVSSASHSPNLKASKKEQK